MFDMCHDHTIQEIKKASFLFIMAYNMSNIYVEMQIVLVFNTN